MTTNHLTKDYHEGKKKELLWTCCKISFQVYFCVAKYFCVLVEQAISGFNFFVNYIFVDKLENIILTCQTASQQGKILVSSELPFN
jgi:hypothetical protein